MCERERLDDDGDTEQLTKKRVQHAQIITVEELN